MTECKWGASVLPSAQPVRLLSQENQGSEGLHLVQSERVQNPVPQKPRPDDTQQHSGALGDNPPDLGRGGVDIPHLISGETKDVITDPWCC